MKVSGSIRRSEATDDVRQEAMGTLKSYESLIDMPEYKPCASTHRHKVVLVNNRRRLERGSDTACASSPCGLEARSDAL